MDGGALAAAARGPGTTTEEETVDTAPAFVAARRQRLAEVLDDVQLIGVGEDIRDPSVVQHARR